MEKKFLEVVLFGDSMTWSSRAPYGKRYADFLEAGLQARLGDDWVVDVAACGEGGNTAAEGLARIARDVLAYAPDVVVVNFGGNDAGRAPSREAFMSAYAAVLDTIRAQARAACVLETLPGLDPERHAWRDREDILRGGGLEAHLEKFAHTFIRQTAAAGKIPLHDRFADFHARLAREPEAWVRLIRPDGVHLTLEGNRVFGETLAELVFSNLPPAPAAAGDRPGAGTWLTRAVNNGTYHACLELLTGGQPLDEIEEGRDAARLMLQQCRSFARRAAALAADPSLARPALIVERLAAGLLAWMRMKNPHADAAMAGDTLAWARRQLQPIDRHPPAVRLIHLLETAAQARGAGAAAG